MRFARIRPAEVVTAKRPAGTVGLHLDRGHLCVHADRRTGLRRHAGQRAASRAPGRHGPPAAQNVAPRRSSARYGANERSSSPSSTRMSRPASSSITPLSCSRRSSSSVSATISPPVMWRSSVPSSSSLERLPHLRRLGVESHLGLQPLAHVLGLAARELVDRDLEVEAAGIRSGRLAVELAPLDEHDLDALAREVVRERGSGEAATDDEHVGARRRRTDEVAPRQPAARGRRGDRCSVAVSHG